MKDNFYQIIKTHREKYPKMEAADYGKLIFQSEFGPNHLIAEKQSVVSYIKQEYAAVSENSSPKVPEWIGGELCRFPLSAITSDRAAGLLAELFILTAETHRGTTEGLTAKIKQLKELGIDGMEEWLKGWEQQGYPSVHHSRAYRGAYQPHYRLLKREYAAYFPALLEIDKLTEQKKNVIIGIDGRCGSGKTRFAELIRTLFSCNVIHMDDFYLPPEKRKENWMDIPGGNMDFTRLRLEVLEPLQSKETAVYRPYCCEKGSIEKGRSMPFHSLTVVEGSYSHHPSLGVPYDLKIFMTCEEEERKKRLREREGSYFAMFQKIWMPMEENYFKCCAIAGNSDLQIDTRACLKIAF